MALDVLGLGLANSYTDETVEGGGAIKGKNCTVDDISKSGKKNTVRFKWTLDDGTVLTGNMEVLDGEDGAPGAPGANGKDGKDGKDGGPGPAGKGIASIEQVTGESQILITYDDGTEADPIDIPTVAGADGKDGKDGTNGTNGTDGVSPTVEVKTSTDSSYILTITDKNGSYDTPNLKGADGADGQDGQDGTDGVGVPSGGTTGQVLKKKSGTDYDTEWGDSDTGTYVSGTLSAGNTSITLSNAKISTANTCLIDWYTSDYSVAPTAITVASGSITFTFEAQQSDIVVSIKISNLT